VCVIITSHELDEVQRLADRVVIIDHGRVVAAGRQGEIQGGSEELRFAAQPGLETGELSVRLGTHVSEGPPGEYLIRCPPFLRWWPNLPRGSLSTICSLVTFGPAASGSRRLSPFDGARRRRADR